MTRVIEAQSENGKMVKNRGDTNEPMKPWPGINGRKTHMHNNNNSIEKLN